MRILFFLLFVSSSVLCQKTVVVDYEMTLKNVVVPDGVPDFAREAIMNKLKEGKHFVLVSNGEKSLYSETKKSPKDEKSVKKVEGNTTTIQNVNFSSGGAIVYKNFENEMLLESTPLLDETLIYEKPFSPSKWKVVDEFTDIEGLKCQKAVVGQPGEEGYAEAWFTTDVPVFDGPGTYFGVPGLVLKVETQSNSIEAKKVKYEEGLKIEPPTKGTKVSYEEYKSRLAELKKNPVRVKTTTNEPVIKRL